ncbi:MAG: DUF502 domain-containing protein [Candidatus Omnitrophica bacterium]|nr:DUF502 domain-containing protein [Candidatus Omnitrophota bacterium]
MNKAKLRRYFITGLIVLLPVFITIYTLGIFIRFLDNLLGRYINYYLNHLFGISVFGVGLLAILGLIFFTGILATSVFVKRIVPFVENWFLRLPLVLQIYPSAKQLVKFLFSEERMAFKKVVIFEYPGKGIYTIGFLTNEFLTKQPDGAVVDMVCVFISSVPNPISGFFVYVPRSAVTFLNITVEEAFKIIISGGVLMRGNELDNSVNF